MNTTVTMNISGPNPSATTLITTATSRVIALPELIDYIGHHLPPSGLLSCIQVCRLWNQVLIPILWHTIDTQRRFWQLILLKDATGVTPKGELDEWLRMIFTKYGLHIRQLITYWRIVLKAASRTGNCRNLCSLLRHDTKYFDRTATATTSTTAMTTTTTTATKVVEEDFQLPWIIPLDQATPNVDEAEDKDENSRQRHRVKWFWILVRQNPGLARLSLPDLDAMNDLSKDYIVETLVSLERLAELDLGRTLLDSQILLRALPKLKHLRVFNLNGLLSMRPEEQYAGLRSLGIRGCVRISEVLEVLDHLPGLEELRFKGVVSEPIDVLRKDVLAAESRRDLQLKSLCIDEVYERNEKYIELLKGQCRHLVHMEMQKLGGSTLLA